jgi:nephrocystin-3
MAVIRRSAAGPGGTTSGQDLRIAVVASGTDVVEDRDLVNRFCLPEVRRHCRGRNIAFSETLLISGTETARELTAGHVAAVLDTIRRDRPVVVCLLGKERGTAVPARVLRSRSLLSRHPWLEHLADEGLSLAEIAILEGVLGNPLLAGRVVVASRIDGRGRESRRASSPLARLTERCKAAGLPIINSYEDRRALSDRICQELIALVDRQLPDAPPPSPLEHVRRAQEAFAASRRQAYVEVSGYSEKLDAHVAGDGSPIVVCGETGSGKSALVANWIERHRAQNPNAFIIAHYAGANGSDSDHLALLRQIMVEIRERYAITEEVPSTPHEIVEAIPIWLARVQREKLILALDGLDQLTAQSKQFEWLPRHIPPQVRLIVSASDGPVSDLLRGRGWGALRLKPLTLSERRSVTKEFLGERSRRLTGDQLRRVTNESTSANPLFLRIRLEELRAHGPAGRLNERIDSFLDAGDLDRLFDRVLDRLERSHDTEMVREVMTLLWASRRGLSASDLETLIKRDTTPLADVLGALDFHLISRDGQLTFFHDCMRHAVAARYGLSADDSARDAHKLLAKFFASQPMSRRRATEEPWQHLRAGNRKKLRECIGSIEMFMELSREESEYELLGYWMTLGSIEEMAVVYEKALTAYEKSATRSHPVALVLDRLGRFFYHAGLFDRAEPLLQRAVDLAQSEIGSTDPRAMEINKHLVQLLLEIGRYAESVERCRAIIDELAPEHGDTHPIVVDALTMLADAHHYLGELQEAEQTARRAVSACERVHGPEHPALAEALFNLSAILRDRGEHSISESLLRRVLAIDEKVYGTDHPTTAMTRSDLGYLLSSTGRYSEAEGALREALAVRERVLGPDHVHTGQSYHTLGQFYTNIDRFDDAERYFRQAIHVFERALGPNHRHLAATIGSLATVLRNQGSLSEAEALTRRALAIIEHGLGTQHSVAMALHGNLGRILLMSGKFDEAEASLRRSYDWFSSSVGNAHKTTAAVALALSEVLREQDKWVEAEKLAESAMIGFRSALGDSHFDTARSIVNLARITQERGDAASSERLAKRALEIFSSMGAADHPIAEDAREILRSEALENDDAAVNAASKEAMEV